MRKRRFNEGGSTEDADKAEGLRLSADDKVGFFERLRMGNIDDPESEAYKRFGAGRAKAARAAAAPAPAPAPARAPAPAPAPAAEDYSRVVDETGSENKDLRRNTETGELYSTKLEEPKPQPQQRKKAVPPTASPAKGSGRGSMAGRRASDDIQHSPGKKASIPTDEPYKAPKSTGELASGPDELDRVLMGAAPGVGAMGAKFLKRLREIEKARRATKRLPLEPKKIGYSKEATEMAKGGSVSSASRRADGCAMRGKTRGKIY